MQFNYSFDITALAFLLVLIVHFFSRKQFPFRSNNFFALVLILVGLDITCDVLGILPLDLGLGVPTLILYFVNLVFYIVQVALPSALTLYILALLSQNHPVSEKRYKKYVIPSLIAEGILLIAFATGKLFAITPEGQYVRGPFAPITYVTFGVYIILTVQLILRNRQFIPQNIRSSYLALLIIVFTCAALQFTHPSQLIIGSGIALSIAIMYFTIEDPSSMADKTTELYNASAFQLFLKSRLIKSLSTRLVVTEVHGLRRVNTFHGIEAGDRILHDIADYLSKDKNAWVFRIAPCRIAMVTFREDTYLNFIGRINEIKNETWNIDGDRIEMSYSVCHIKNIQNFQTPSDIINVIDRAMDKLIESGDRQKVFEIESMDLQEFETLQIIENALKTYISTGEHFNMFYQPIFNTKTQMFDSAEALLRFEIPGLGNVSPAEFIPIAEANGMSVALDNMVVHKVFDDIAGGAFAKLNPEHVHINLSSASFIDDSITNMILEEIDRYGIDPRFVVLEITEDTASETNNMLSHCMEILAEAGIKLSLDDFGTGYSNILRILEHPFDIIKIDRSLLFSGEDLYRDIVKTISHFAPNLLAEGVETKEQAKFVASLGVEEIQGYYYSKPLPVDQIREFGPYYEEK